MSPVTLEFCGECFEVAPGTTFAIGRDGDLAVDDNPFLHRRLLEITSREGFTWVANVGSRIVVHVTSEDGAFEAWLAPGAQLPVVLPWLRLRFDAGSTGYEVVLRHDAAADMAPAPAPAPSEDTIGLVPLTLEQRQLVVALAEPVLRSGRRSMVTTPTSAEAAARLGWPITKFNRKLDNVCQKLARIGVRGLHGAPGELAANRRERLVEYALLSRLVTEDDLATLPPLRSGA